MTHRFLLHLYRRSRLVQPRTVRVAKRVPTEIRLLPCDSLTLLVNQKPLTVRRRMILLTPGANTGPALSALNKAASSHPALLS